MIGEFHLIRPHSKSAFITRDGGGGTQKRVLAVISTVLAAAVLAHAQPANLSLGSGAGVPGSNVTLDLTLGSSAAQSAAIQWSLQYSTSDIIAVTTISGPAADLANKSVVCSAASGSMTCILYGLNQTVIADGVIAHLTLTLAFGTPSTLSNVQLVNVVLVDATGTSIPVSAYRGAIIIIQPAVITTLSCSAVSLNPNSASTCSVTLSKAAPATGSSVALASSSSSLTVPPSVLVASGATTASFTAAAGSFTTDGSAQITASLNTSTATASLNLVTLPQITTLSCSAVSLNPNSASTCSVTLSKAAPATGSSVALASSSSSLTVPPSVLVASGATTASFTATAGSFTTDGSAQITASLNASTQVFTLSLTTKTSIQVSNLSCSPVAVAPGGSATCTGQFNPPTKTKLTLLVSSSSASVVVPQSVTTRPHQTKYSFTAKAVALAQARTAIISVSYLSSAATFDLTVLAPAAPAMVAPTSVLTTANEPVSLVIQASDPNGQKTDLSAHDLPEGAVFTVTAAPQTSDAENSLPTSATAVLEWTPTLAQIGIDIVHVTATSPAGSTTREIAVRVVSPVPHVDKIVNAASSSSSQVCSPGGLASIQGTALQASPVRGKKANSSTWLSINGDSAEIVAASEAQLTFRCPEGIPGQPLSIQVANRFGASNVIVTRMQGASPGIFSLDSSGTGQGLVFLSGTSDLAMLTDPAFPGQPALPGDTIDIMVTGLGNTRDWPVLNSLPIVTIGQLVADVVSVVDLLEFPGISVITVRVPSAAPVGDNVPLEVVAGNQAVQSNVVTIGIAPPIGF